MKNMNDLDAVLDAKQQFQDQLQQLMEHPELILIYDLGELLSAASIYRQCLCPAQKDVLDEVSDIQPIQVPDVHESIPALRPQTEGMLDFVPTVLDRLAHNHSRSVSIEAMGRIESLVRMDWPDLDAPVAVEIAHFIVAHTQAASIRAKPSESLYLEPRIREIFSVLKQRVDAFIHGMSKEHQPKYGSWAEDCQYWATQLKFRLGQGEPVQESTTASKKPRSSKVLTTWPTEHLWQDLRVVLFGGVQNTTALNRLKLLSQCDDIQWVDVQESKGFRAVEAMCRRIEQDHFDVVMVVNRFISHSASDKIRTACKYSNCTLLFLESGYGADSIYRAWVDAR